MGGAGPRRRAREHAMQVLYSLDMSGQLGGLTPALVENTLLDFWARFEEPQERTVVAFCSELVKGACQHMPEIDETIQKVSRNWRLERMARVDRNILRMATYELLFVEEVPAKVVINEAIEVAKRFGTAESPAFVNGLLDRISQEGRAR